MFSVERVSKYNDGLQDIAIQDSIFHGRLKECQEVFDRIVRDNRNFSKRPDSYKIVVAH
jgi:hypothetical protein